jgi:hypothetical protein
MYNALRLPLLASLAAYVPEPDRTRADPTDQHDLLHHQRSRASTSSAGPSIPQWYDNDLPHHGRMWAAGVWDLAGLGERDHIGTPGHELAGVEGAVNRHSAVFDVRLIRPAHTIASFDGEVTRLKALRCLKGHLDLVDDGTLLRRHRTALLFFFLDSRASTQR